MPSAPNLLLLFTDDQRFDTIAAMGNPAIHTPNLDALAARGTAFTRAHIMGGSSGAVCMPSRAMLHTGRSLYHIHRQGQTIDPDHVMLGEHLAARGYDTWGCGKWHNGTQAFNRAFGDGAEIFFGGMNDHWNVPACNYDPTGEYDNNVPRCVDAFSGKRLRWFHTDHVHAGYHSTDLFADAVIDRIRGYEGDRPWFNYVSFMAPHDPRVMPERFLEMYPPDSIELPPNFMPEHPFDNGAMGPGQRDENLAAHPRTEDEVREHLRDYYAMISHIDEAIGRIVTALETTGQLDNTILVFAGDNGLSVGQHGLMGKQNLYEHSVRVPLLFAGPGVPRGERRDQLCCLIDIYRTLCDLAGLDTPDTVEGRSLQPILDDTAASGPNVLPLAFMTCQRAVRDDRYKLIEYVVGHDRHTQLFDLHDDPHELNNLADAPAHADVLERLRHELRRWQTELGDDQPGQGGDFWSGYR